MENELSEVAKATEQLVHTVLSVTTDNAFEMSGARVYGVRNGEIILLAEHADIYDLLADDDVRDEAKTYEYTTVVTTGWAAPLGANGEVEGAPSEHRERRRVRLSIIANADGVASVLRFADDPDNVIIDEGSATGSLNDAIRQFVAD